VKKRSSTGNQIIKPLLLSILQISFIYYCITQTQFSFYQPYQNDITLGLAAILLLQTTMTAIGWNGSTA
jgi:predicted Co/Zn/Cd cation transporter (cation efflux family)